jgi:hypothetical protein
MALAVRVQHSEAFFGGLPGCIAALAGAVEYPFGYEASKAGSKLIRADRHGDGDRLELLAMQRTISVGHTQYEKSGRHRNRILTTLSRIGRNPVGRFIHDHIVGHAARYCQRGPLRWIFVIL